MAQTGELSSQLESVQSTLNYITPGGEKPVTESNLPGEVRVTSNTGNYQAHPVTIRNGRLSGGFSLDKEG
ncbi:MAG: CmcJ/NvfI family oxidoreductase, partial [Candidatus Binatia bacterium]